MWLRAKSGQVIKKACESTDEMENVFCIALLLCLRYPKNMHILLMKQKSPILTKLKILFIVFFFNI